MLSLGLWGGLGHYFTARAYQCAPASVVAPFSYLQLVGAAIAGYLVFDEVPGAGVWIGAALIVASGLFLVYAEGRARRAVSPRHAPRRSLRCRGPRAIFEEEVSAR